MVTGELRLAKPSRGSPGSRLFWHPPAPLGYCQGGTWFDPKGSFIHSEISWVAAVTSTKLGPKIPGSTQLAHTKVCNTWRPDCTPASKAVWKPTVQHCCTVAPEERKTLEVSAMVSASGSRFCSCRMVFRCEMKKASSTIANNAPVRRLR